MPAMTLEPTAADRWIEAARAGDPEAFAALYRDLAPQVLRFLTGLRLPLERADLEDALQETFVRLHHALPRLEPGRALAPFALGIARHVALDLCRRVRPAAPEEQAERPADGPSPSERMRALELQALIDAALAALDPEQRTLLTLRHVSGLRMRAIEEALGCSAPTARARLRAAASAFALELRRRGVLPEEVCA